MNEEKKSVRCRADFIQQAGIGTKLADFLTEYIDRPEIFYSMPVERRREIEDQMDTVLLSFGKNS